MKKKIDQFKTTASLNPQCSICEASGSFNEAHRKLSTVEAAKYLGLRPNTLEVWRHQRKGPKYMKLGRRVLYDIVELERFTRLCTISTNAQLQFNSFTVDGGKN